MFAEKNRVSVLLNHVDAGVILSVRCRRCSVTRKVGPRPSRRDVFGNVVVVVVFKEKEQLLAAAPVPELPHKTKLIQPLFSLFGEHPHLFLIASPLDPLSKRRIFLVLCGNSTVTILLDIGSELLQHFVELRIVKLCGYIVSWWFSLKPIDSKRSILSWSSFPIRYFCLCFSTQRPSLSR